MAITVQEMQREVVAYGMAEMRNRGIEESARLIEQIANGRRYSERFDLERLAVEIRRLKADPSSHLSDWWAETSKQAVPA